MRQLVTAAFVAAVFAITATAAAAPTGWSLSGPGTFRGPAPSPIEAGMDGTARSDVGGANAKGRLHLFYDGILDAHVDVACLAVDGNRAGVLGKLAHPFSFGGQIWQYAGISVTDNGSRGTTPDQATFWLTNDATQSTCAGLAAAGGAWPIANGDFGVTSSASAQLK